MAIRTFVISLLSAVAILCFFSFEEETLVWRLKKRLEGYLLEHPSINLYLHLDKDIYMAGETVWFKAYLPSTSIIESEVLFVRLIDEKKQVVAEKEFLVYDIRSHGEITIPNDLYPGTYTLCAFSDKMVNFGHEDAFGRKIKIAANPGNMIRASAHVVDTASLKPGETVNIRVKAEVASAAVRQARGTYTITTATGKKVKEGKFSTDARGNADIRFVYPEIAETETLALHATVAKGGADTEIKLLLPPAHQKLYLRALSGNANPVRGVPCKLILETTDQHGYPVAAKVTLLSQGKPIHEASTNEHGLAALSFTPEDTAGYTFRLEHRREKTEEKFPLQIKEKGWVLNVRTDGKEKEALLYNVGMHEKAVLLLRSHTDILWHHEAKVKSGDSLRLKLPMADSIKQITSLALFDHRDSLWSERLLSSRKDEHYQVAVTFDKKGYGAGERGKAVVSVTDDDGKPVESNLSISIVSTRSLDDKIRKNILQAQEEATTLRHQTDAPSQNTMEELLLAAQWKRANWQQVLAYTPVGNIRIRKNTGGVVGYVKAKSKKKLDLEEITLFAAAGVMMVPVQENGFFSIPPNYLLAGDGQDNHLMTNEAFRKRYEVELVSHFDDFENLIIDALSESDRPNYMTATPPAEQLPMMAGMINLRAVEITAKVEDNNALLDFQKLQREYPPNCLDWVCHNNIINCNNHKTSDRPIFGQTYGGTLYTKCRTIASLKDTPQANSILLKSISIPEEFPLPDPDEIPEMLSTIYWAPNINTNEQGEAELDFITSALKGDFVLMVQGLEVHSLKAIYGSETFKVN